MEKNKVSVVIPIYNVADYLDVCIASVCAQTYQNIEIILVDDGSTDGSPQSCDSWKEKDSRIRVIHKENGGLSSARNAGLDIATGTYILFVDGDDAVRENLLDATIPYMDKGYETVSFGYQNVFPSGVKKDIHFPDRNITIQSSEKMIDFIIGPFFRYEVGWQVTCRIFRRDYLEHYQIRFVDTKRIFAEDQHFCLCYLIHCSKMKVLSKCLYFYYQRENSIMGTSNKEQQIHVGQKNELAYELLRYYESQGVSQTILNRFPVIHYHLLERAVQDVENRERDSSTIRKIVLNDIRTRSDISFFESEMKQALKQKKIIRREYSAIKTLTKMSRIHVILGRSSVIYKQYLMLKHRIR